MNTKKVFVYGARSLLCAFAVMFALALALATTACGGDDDPDVVVPIPHTHSYGTAWSFDTTQHWHECTANDGAKSEVAAHTSPTGGGVCTVCGYDNTPTVTSVTVTAGGNATSVAKGGTLQFNAVVAGTNSPAQTVEWSIVESGKHAQTVISGSGLLTVNAAETLTSITVKAVSTVNTGISGTKSVTVIGAMIWTAVDSTFDTSDINAITSAGNQFAAVGNDGKIAYSSDGTTWTATNKPITGARYRAVAHGYSKFVAGDSNGNIATGVGTNWTAQETRILGTFTSGAGGQTYANGIFGIACNNPSSIFSTTFVAVGMGVAVSTTGNTWTAVTPRPGTFNGIAYSNDKFVAVGGSGTMAYRTDITTSWSAISNGTIWDFQWQYEGSTVTLKANIYAIAYGDGTWVAVGEQGKMAYSPDDFSSWPSWRAVGNTRFGADDTIRAIAYGNGKFIAGGDNGKMAYSENGTTWTAIANTTFGAGDTIYAIAYGNNKFVAVGSSGKMAYSTGAIE